MVDPVEVLRSEYELRDAGCFPNALRYEVETQLHKFVSVLAPFVRADLFVLITARDSFDDGLCRALLLFLDSRVDCLSLENGVTVCDGFSCEGFAFDSVLVLNGPFHKMYEHVSGELNRQVLAAFPVFRHEFTGTETAVQMDDIRHDGPCTSDWSRGPCPYVLMKFRNQVTGAGSRGNRFWYTKVSYVNRVVLDLAGGAESFIELKNYLNQQVRIVAENGDYTVDSGTVQFHVERHHMVDWIGTFLAKGLQEV